MATPNVTSVNGSTLSQQLVPSRSTKTEVIIQNDSSSPLYIAFGSTASPSSYTTKLYSDDVLTTSYKGQINGVWATATGNARITEIQ